MKKFWKRDAVRPLLFVLLLLGAELMGAATRRDVRLLEASEEIKFISQQIVMDYFYLALNPQKREPAVNLRRSLTQLDEQLRLIATSTKNEDTKDVLTFLAFSRDQIFETISQPYSKENGALMLDYSEVLLEGAESIASNHAYTFSKEEQMLIDVKGMAYLVERITKYYMAFQAGFDDLNNVRQLKEAVDLFEHRLGQIEHYLYRGGSAEARTTVKRFWSVVKPYYLTLDKSKMPNILYLSAGHLEEILRKLELYHIKNL